MGLCGSVVFRQRSGGIGGDSRVNQPGTSQCSDVQGQNVSMHMCSSGWPRSENEEVCIRIER